jgi:CRP-like cAMP-binding protein
MVYKNRILRALPPKESRLIVPQLKPVLLAKDLVLYEPGTRIKRVYFPDDALISYLSGTADGESIEVSVVGNEGVVGLSALLSDRTTFRATVQIPGRAYEIASEFLKKEFVRCDVIHRTLLHYTNAFITQLAQTGVCNRFHSTQERFSRWLLMVHDRIGRNQIPMTQDGMARILGSRRASISGVAGAFQKRGVIQYNRGAIAIVDRKSLESEACECYQTIVAAHDSSHSGKLRS